jgi:anti-sigma-K factor RskA
LSPVFIETRRMKGATAVMTVETEKRYAAEDQVPVRLPEQADREKVTRSWPPSPDNWRLAIAAPAIAAILFFMWLSSSTYDRDVDWSDQS